ncbi:hypothetical protein DENSPDRAFT_806586 [Dentipellis sp. KUC8613]|nr:hypothetical protein DENSPDRAFT_806586 [Dentipellis sp. KUC8613]
MTTHVGILPLDVLDTISMKLSADAASPQFLRLPHPRTGIPSLFLPYRLKDTVPVPGQVDAWGILEVQSVEPPNPRSWFFTEGQVVGDGKLLIMTPVDPAFLLIPLIELTKPAEGHAGTFRALDDIFDEALVTLQKKPQKPIPGDPTSTLCEKDVLALSALDCARSALARICDTKDITPEITVYRYSSDAVVRYLRSKVARLAAVGVSEASKTIVRRLARDGLMEDGKEALLELGRTKAACDLLSQYLSPATHAALLATYDFAPLDAHVKALQDEAAAAALANAPLVKGKNSAKGEGEEDGKKRKAKARGSVGVEKLKKANVSGMSKISTFFQKK